MEILHPTNETRYSDRVNSVAGQLGDMTGKRVGGGRVQMGLVTFEELASVLVKNEVGFDKQAKSKWAGQPAALQRVFAEYGYPAFERAVIIAVIRKWTVDPADGFIPLACGTIDIEAGLNIEADLHKEAVISGIPAEPDAAFAEAIAGIVGITTEYGNPGSGGILQSLEFVVPLYTPGTWLEIKDTEFGRRTGVIIVTPTLKLYCEGMDVNGLQPLLEKLLSVKTVEAVKIAEQLCRECNIL